MIFHRPLLFMPTVMVELFRLPAVVAQSSIHGGGINHRAAVGNTGGITVARTALHLSGDVIARSPRRIAVRDPADTVLCPRVDRPHRRSGRCRFSRSPSPQIFSFTESADTVPLKQSAWYRRWSGAVIAAAGGRHAGIDVQHKPVPIPC